MEKKYRDLIPAEYTDEDAEQILRDIYTISEVLLNKYEYSFDKE